MDVPRAKRQEYGQFIQRCQNGTDNCVFFTTFMADGEHSFPQQERTTQGVPAGKSHWGTSPKAQSS
jgi:hypothetical protein